MSIYDTSAEDHRDPGIKAGQNHAPYPSRSSLRARRAALSSGLPLPKEALPDGDAIPDAFRAARYVRRQNRILPAAVLVLFLAVPLLLSAGGVSLPFLLLSGTGASLPEDLPEDTGTYTDLRDSCIALGEEIVRDLRFDRSAVRLEVKEQSPDITLLRACAEAVRTPNGSEARLREVLESLVRRVVSFTLHETDPSGNRNVTDLRFRVGPDTAALLAPVTLFPDTTDAVLTVTEQPVTEEEILACLDPEEAERFRFYLEILTAP